MVTGTVGVKVMVGVSVMVAVGPPGWAAGTPPVRRMATKTNTAPITSTKTSNPSAAGRLRVISGIRLADTATGRFGSGV